MAITANTIYDHLCFESINKGQWQKIQYGNGSLYIGAIVAIIKQTNDISKYLSEKLHFMENATSEKR